MPDDTVVADLIQSEIRFLKSGKIISFNEERNDFQRKEIKHFLRYWKVSVVCDLLTALNTLIAKGEHKHMNILFTICGEPAQKE